MASLSKNILYSSVLTGANYIFPLIVYPYVSRVLGVDKIGLCGFVDGIIDYFILLSMIGIQVIGVREIATYQGNRDKQSEALSTILTINVFMTLISLIALVFCTFYVEQLRENWTFMTVGAFKLVFNMFLIEWFYKGIENFRFITIRSLLVRCIYVGVVFATVRNEDDALNYYIATTLTIVFNACINLVYSRKFATISYRFVNMAKLKQLLSPLFILGFYFLLTSMYTSFNVIFLGFVCDEYQVGLYTTASKFYGILIALYTSFTTVMMPRMSNLLANGKVDEFKRHIDMSVNVLLMFCIPVITFVLVYASELILVLSGPGYGDAAAPTRIIIPQMFIIGYSQIMVVQCLMPLKADKSVLRYSGMGAIVGVILNVLLVKSYGAVGSAWAWIMSECTVMTLSQIFVFRHVKISFQLKKIVWHAICYIPLGLILYCINLCIPNYIASLITGSLVALLYFVAVNVFVFRDSLFFQYIRRLIPASLCRRS